jgi:hypothetical protein
MTSLTSANGCGTPKTFCGLKSNNVLKVDNKPQLTRSKVALDLLFKQPSVLRVCHATVEFNDDYAFGESTCNPKHSGFIQIVSMR